MPDVNDLASLVWRWRTPGRLLVVGVTGGVACGKSTLADALAERLRARIESPRVDKINTDGFLRSNASLIAAGLLDKKGFPETYDREALVAALRQARIGPVAIPAYSHVHYDVDPAASRVIDRPDILLVEGLGLDDVEGVDRLIYIDAAETDQEAWFVTRFLAFCRAGRQDDSSFYARFRDLDEAAAADLGAMVWRTINRPNLRDHIAPVMSKADLVVSKAADHSLRALALKG